MYQLMTFLREIVQYIDRVIYIKPLYLQGVFYMTRYLSRIPRSEVDHHNCLSIDSQNASDHDRMGVWCDVIFWTILNKLKTNCQIEE